MMRAIYKLVRKVGLGNVLILGYILGASLVLMSVVRWHDGDAARGLQVSMVNEFLQISAILVAGVWALHRFVLTRAGQSFLQVNVEAEVIESTANLVLVAVYVTLENKGETRINARKGDRAYLYDDEWDRCKHAGTLKIRPIPQANKELSFDWYSLDPMPCALRRSTLKDAPGDVKEREGDLEQINYLGDSQDSEVDFDQVDFWIEPHETYTLAVPVWLQPGLYAIKAYFLGKELWHGEEEYWCCTRFRQLTAQTVPDAP